MFLAPTTKRTKDVVTGGVDAATATCTRRLAARIRELTEQRFDRQVDVAAHLAGAVGADPMAARMREDGGANA
jgi:hypothetical protein